MARTGAKKATLNEYNPRELVALLMKQHPQAGSEELFGYFEHSLCGSFINYQQSVNRYCFDNQFRAINDEAPPRKGKLSVVATASASAHAPIPAAQVAAEREQAARAATARLVNLAPVLFMKLPTPFTHADGSHKTLGELTGKEGRKLTGGLAKFFKDVPDNKRLLDVKSEAKLRELWAKL
jgi:hypothetical protein